MRDVAATDEKKANRARYRPKLAVVTYKTRQSGCPPCLSVVFRQPLYVPSISVWSS